MSLIVGLVMVLGLTFTVAASPQDQRSPELFAAIPHDQLPAATPTQSRRLAQIRRLPTTGALHLVKTNQKALLGDQFTLSIPGDGMFKVRRTGGEGQNEQNFTWFGKLSDGVPGTATFVVRKGIVTGSIRSAEGLYRLQYIGRGIHAVVKVDTSKLPPEETPDFPERELQPQEHKPGPTDRGENTADVMPTQIDVLIAYTPAAKTAATAVTTDIDTLIATAVAESNAAYVNSSVNVHLNLVSSFQVDYSELKADGITQKSYPDILADFVAMPNVHTRRLTSGADLVALIIDQPSACGYADAIMADASTAYVIVHYNCAIGYYSVAHEFGHLMGCRHDPDVDPTDTPFSYGHGYVHHGTGSTDPSWRTVMAYGTTCNGCPRLQYFSDPDIKYNGYPMGTATRNDCHRVLNETASTVAAFYRRPHITFPRCLPGMFHFAPCMAGGRPGIQRAVCENGQLIRTGSCVPLSISP